MKNNFKKVTHGKGKGDNPECLKDSGITFILNNNKFRFLCYERYFRMWNIPSKKRLAQIPKLNQTQNILFRNKFVYLHFYIGNSDWYVCEFDGEDIFNGFVIFNDDFESSEWGSFSFENLKQQKIGGFLEITCDSEKEWKIREACEIERLSKTIL